jgi:hypothetical protein
MSSYTIYGNLKGRPPKNRDDNEPPSKKRSSGASVDEAEILAMKMKERVETRLKMAEEPDAAQFSQLAAVNDVATLIDEQPKAVIAELQFLLNEKKEARLGEQKELIGKFQDWKKKVRLMTTDKDDDVVCKNLTGMGRKELREHKIKTLHRLKCIEFVEKVEPTINTEKIFEDVALLAIEKHIGKKERAVMRISGLQSQEPDAIVFAVASPIHEAEANEVAINEEEKLAYEYDDEVL